LVGLRVFAPIAHKVDLGPPEVTPANSTAQE
jgi:hypothetical protein